VANRLEKVIGVPVTCGNEPRTGFPWTHVDGISTFGGRHYGDWLAVCLWDARLILTKTSLVQSSCMWGSIRIGFLEGMVDFTENLRQLIERGDIDKATGLEFAPNPEQLKMAIKGIKVAAPGIL
jgi:hypothetical protein